jgi:hypothetical protein
MRRDCAYATMLPNRPHDDMSEAVKWLALNLSSRTSAPNGSRLERLWADLGSRSWNWMRQQSVMR